LVVRSVDSQIDGRPAFLRRFSQHTRKLTGLGPTCRFRKLDSRVSMVPPAKNRKRDNVSKQLDRTCIWSILAYRNVSAHFIIVARVRKLALRAYHSKAQGLCVRDVTKCDNPIMHTPTRSAISR
jgi:hypothetical protein